MGRRQVSDSLQAVSIDKARQMAIKCFRAGLVPFVTSPPGIGKSDMARQIAKKFNLKYIDVRLTAMDQTDMNGFPMLLNRDPTKAKAGFVPMSLFPVEGDAIPEGYDGWLVNLDEFPSASLALQTAAYKFILDRMVGMHKLHSKVFVMAMGNGMDDNAIVNYQGTAMQSRLIHIAVKVCFKTFMKWAVANNIDTRLTSYLEFKPDHLHKFDTLYINCCKHLIKVKRLATTLSCGREPLVMA
jgi:hypothetical protein